MSFNLGFAVVDVEWSPFKSTIFIALSLKKCYVYDLAVNRHSREEEEKGLQNGMTNLAINPRDPIFLISNSQGKVGCAKLAQNLAKRKFLGDF